MLQVFLLSQIQNLEKIGEVRPGLVIFFSFFLFFSFSYFYLPFFLLFFSPKKAKPLSKLVSDHLLPKDG